MDLEPRYRLCERSAVHDGPLRSGSQVRVLQPRLDLERLTETLDIPARNRELTQFNVERTLVVTAVAGSGRAAGPAARGCPRESGW